jgi:hypothetical protein
MSTSSLAGSRRAISDAVIVAAPSGGIATVLPRPLAPVLVSQRRDEEAIIIYEV